jgi:hypothetical protein
MSRPHCRNCGSDHVGPYYCEECGFDGINTPEKNEEEETA